MTSNRDWLFSLPLDEQLAWMNAEHVEGVEIQGEVCDFEHEADSREKLEVDLNDWCLQLWDSDTVSGYQAANLIKREVWKLLDRQAAITEREFVQQYCAECETAENAALKDDIATLRNRLDKLQAENDELLAAHADDVERLDAMGEGELQKQVDELRAELGKWEKLAEGIALPDYPMCEYQPNSRADLEAEVHYWLTSHVAVSVNVGEIEAEVRKWLDRQSAITEQKVKLRICWGEYDPDAVSVQRDHAELFEARLRQEERKVAKLEAEVEDYRRKLSHAVDNAHDTCMLMDEGYA